MPYVTPADVTISDSWQGHKNRQPPSGEPGTDFATSYSTPVRAAEAGTVADLKHDNGDGTGRYLAVDLDDGRRVRYLHLSEVWLSVGDRVRRGDWVGASGASGKGSDWGYGAHVHVTLFPGHWYDFGHTLDFMLYVGEPAPPPPPPNTPEGEAVMYIEAISNGEYAKQGTIYANDIGGHWRGVTNLEGDGYIKPLAEKQLPFAKFAGTDLDLLFAVNGMWEQTQLDASAPPWSSGQQLAGSGPLTGRLRYPGAAGNQGEWHNPYADAPAPPTRTRTHQLTLQASTGAIALVVLAAVAIITLVLQVVPPG